ncbi:unnamed protein product [Darwinula stevensoni]|uniref:Metalloendopeptidase n=1 Tax=Darwinula stevensoni TaxID=69355 RepID=A0A7R9A623_9CRUS|nr:unnamed protein product [Darwinula stevensoni]CAG0887851.1 unnamed protein product [Darwinula stevensoni]
MIPGDPFRSLSISFVDVEDVWERGQDPDVLVPLILFLPRFTSLRQRLETSYRAAIPFVCGSGPNDSTYSRGTRASSGGRAEEVLVGTAIRSGARLRRKVPTRRGRSLSRGPGGNRGAMRKISRDSPSRILSVGSTKKMKTRWNRMGPGLGWALLLLVSSSPSAAHPVAEKKPGRPEVTPDMTGPYFQGDIMTLPGQDPQNVRPHVLRRDDSGGESKTCDVNFFSGTEFRGVRPIVSRRLAADRRVLASSSMRPSLVHRVALILSARVRPSRVERENVAIRQEQRQVFAQAISIYERSTCLRFRERTSEDSGYINVVPDADTTCSSYVGYMGSSQEMRLADRCFQKIGIVLHEIMHAIGFYHEQSRADRDDWVVINWSNIEEGKEHNFEKYSLDEITHLGTEYDYGSVLHYGAYGFAIDPDVPTIDPIFAEPGDIGQREGFSENDLIKINRLYECPQH